jgi:hypothetical protein
MLAAGVIPAGLSPFADEPFLVPDMSIGLRLRGQVVAWITMTRAPLVADAVCCRSLFLGLRSKSTSFVSDWRRIASKPMSRVPPPNDWLCLDQCGAPLITLLYRKGQPFLNPFVRDPG